MRKNYENVFMFIGLEQLVIILKRI